MNVFQPKPKAREPMPGRNMVCVTADCTGRAYLCLNGGKGPWRCWECHQAAKASLTTINEPNTHGRASGPAETQGELL